MTYADAVFQTNDKAEKFRNLYFATPQNRKRITAARGRLLSAIAVERRLAPPADLPAIDLYYNQEIHQHQIDLNDRLMHVKQSKGSAVKQIHNELVIKIRQLRNTERQIQQAPTRTEKLEQGAVLAAKALGTAGTVLKAPIIVTLNIAGKLTNNVAQIVVTPLHLVSNLSQQLINPKSPYHGKTITKMGTLLGNQLNKSINAVNNGVRKL